MRNIFDNSRIEKAWVSCLYDSEVVNPSFVLLMEFSARKPALRQAPKRYRQYKNLTQYKILWDH